ncbi:MAG: hypothetical protein SynsKO_15090 [Synoicihabitans sp.]
MFARRFSSRRFKIVGLWGLIGWVVLISPGCAAEPPPVRPAGLPAHYIRVAEALASWKLAPEPLDTDGKQIFRNAWTELALQRDSREIYLNGLRIFLGEGILRAGDELWLSRVDQNKLLSPLLRPVAYADTARPVKRIMIDAGHGGKDRGTYSDPLALAEKHVALDVALRLGEILQQQGFEILQIRTDDTFVEKGERARLAVESGADLFVSIHFNAAGNPEANGSETYVLTPARQRSSGDSTSSPAELPPEPGNVTDPWNAILGHEVHKAMINRLGTTDRGLKRARFAVLRLNEIPSVLVEAGFLSHEAEAQEIASPRRRGEIAEAIANGIVAYSTQVAAVAPRP